MQRVTGCFAWDERADPGPFKVEKGNFRVQISESQKQESERMMRTRVLFLILSILSIHVPLSAEGPEHR
jgi:hypothetical protein